MISYEIRECTAEDCGFRFPMGEEEKTSFWKGQCPRCGTPTVIVAQHYVKTEKNISTIPISLSPPVEALLDNIRSTWNVGSMFRSADGAGIRHLYLCGITSTPQHPKVTNTALGAERCVSWSYHQNAYKTAHQCKERGWHLLALESGLRKDNLPPTSLVDFSQGTLQKDTSDPFLLIVGNEKYGIDPEIISLCEQILYIPMVGNKGSLNVAVAFGIAAYGIKMRLCLK